MATDQLHQLDNFDKFFNMTQNQFTEYELWKLETDLAFIYFDGRKISVNKVTYLQWFSWMLEGTTVEVANDMIEVEYELLN
jgi:hypothetical protein